MTAPQLSPRLRMVIGLVPPEVSCCDIGTDHGYIAIELAQNGHRVVAMDVNRGPLLAAERNIRRFGVTDRVVTRLSWGFRSLEDGEAECAVISGMGGELIAQIIGDAPQGVKYMVLQPQSCFFDLRDYLNNNGFFIKKEELCREADRYYCALLVTRGEQRPLDLVEKQIGPRLIEEDHPLLREYAAYRSKELEYALEKIGSAATPRREEYQQLIGLYRKITYRGNEKWSN